MKYVFGFGIILFFIGCSSDNECNSEFVKNKIIEENNIALKNTPAYNFLNKNIKINFDIKNATQIKENNNIKFCSADLLQEYILLEMPTDVQKKEIIKLLNLNNINDSKLENHKINYIVTTNENNEVIIK